MNDVETIIEKIHSLEGQEQAHVPWLLSLLDQADGAIRLSALNALVHQCSVPNLQEKLWAMLENEPDEDVLLVVISALSAYHRGSKELKIICRFQEAVKRVGGGLAGTRETFDDAKLCIMLGYDPKRVVSMTLSERLKRLAEINAQLGIG